MRWLKQLFFRRRHYDELSESIRSHLDEKIADLMGHAKTWSRQSRQHTANLAMSPGLKNVGAKCGSRPRWSLLEQILRSCYDSYPSEAE